MISLFLVKHTFIYINFQLKHHFEPFLLLFFLIRGKKKSTLHLLIFFGFVILQIKGKQKKKKKNVRSVESSGENKRKFSALEATQKIIKCELGKISKRPPR